MVEILVALVFVSFSFLPIYNLFRFGQKGTVSNEKEIKATNYASDLINLIRDRKAKELDKAFGSPDVKEFKTEEEIADALKKIDANLAIPVPEEGYERSMTLQRFKGKAKISLNIIPWLKELFNSYPAVPNYLVTVKINFAKKGQPTPDDEVCLMTIVMD